MPRGPRCPAAADAVADVALTDDDDDGGDDDDEHDDDDDDHDADFCDVFDKALNPGLEVCKWLRC